MSEEIAFWEQIAEQPDDDQPRLVYADWLEEAGREEQAEAIRVGCAAAQRLPDSEGTPEDSPEERIRKESQLRSRAYQLEQKCLPYWKKCYKGTSPHIDFYKGLPHTMAIAAKKFLEVAEGFTARGPIRGLRITQMPDYAEAVLACPALEPFRGLDLSRSKMSSNVSLVFTSPHLTSLLSLSLGGNSLRQRDLEERLSQARLPALKILGLANMKLSDAAIKILADWPLLTQLDELWLSHNNITLAGVRTLLDSPHVRDELILSFTGNPADKDLDLRASQYVSLTQYNAGRVRAAVT